MTNKRKRKRRVKSLRKKWLKNKKKKNKKINKKRSRNPQLKKRRWKKRWKKKFKFPMPQLRQKLLTRCMRSSSILRLWMILQIWSLKYSTFQCLSGQKQTSRRSRHISIMNPGIQFLKKWLMTLTSSVRKLYHPISGLVLRNLKGTKKFYNKSKPWTASNSSSLARYWTRRRRNSGTSLGKKENFFAFPSKIPRNGKRTTRWRNIL